MTLWLTQLFSKKPTMKRSRKKEGKKPQQQPAGGIFHKGDIPLFLPFFKNFCFIFLLFCYWKVEEVKKLTSRTSLSRKEYLHLHHHFTFHLLPAFSFLFEGLFCRGPWTPANITETFCCYEESKRAVNNSWWTRRSIGSIISVFLIVERSRGMLG